MNVARKMLGPNQALSRAIFESGLKKRDIARASRMAPSTLSCILHGFQRPTEEQMARLAMTLRKKKVDLFPEEE
jgi:transcriptional regulator with XRE-family HTH domain